MTPLPSRKIIHVDMDAFYASVEQRDRPELKDTPVIVGGLGGRGVVAAASYEARRFGVHSAMPMARARKLCPQATFLAARIGYYREISEQIRHIFRAYTSLVEPISLDEAFLDVTHSPHGPVTSLAQQIKARIGEETDLTCSIGVAPNKFLAKLASDMKKPDGLVVIRPDQIEARLAPLPVNKIWGVGEATEKKLHAIGVRTIGALRNVPRRTLKEQFGKYGARLYHLARGIDDRPVEPEREPKSISREVTFETDVRNPDRIVRTLHELSDAVAQKLRESRLNGRTVQIKVRFPDFTTITRSTTLNVPTHATEVIRDEVVALFANKMARRHGRGIRLLGVGVVNLSQQKSQPLQLPLPLFQEQSAKQTEIDRLLDKLQKQFGNRVVRRGIQSR
ncbi:MAG: DNA polymerase IV [Candidatus Bipolaricaulia bacterium]